MSFSGISVRKIVFLGAVIAASALLRFWALGERGLLMWDEAYYALESKTIPSAISYFLKGTEGGVSLKEHLVSSGCVLPTGTGKPVFVFLLSAWGSVFGSTDLALLSMVALFGTLSLLIVHYIASRCANETAGMLAALMLGLSGMHIWYSRGLSPTVASSFFFLCALALYVSRVWTQGGVGGRVYSFLAGFLAAFSFMSHYVIIPNLAALCAVEICRLWLNRRDIYTEAARTFMLLAGFLTALFCVEAAYRITYYFAGDALSNIAHMTYFESLYRQMTWAYGGSRSFSGWRLYYSGLSELSGSFSLWFYLAVSVTAAFMGVFGSNRKQSIVFVQLLATVIFWGLNRGGAVLRAITVFSPLAAIAASFVITGFADRINRPYLRSVLVLGLLSSAILPGIASIPEMLKIKNPYPQINAWFSGKQGQPVIMTNWPFFQFYSGKKIYLNDDRIRTPRDLQGAYNSGARYLLTDYTEKQLFSSFKTDMREEILRISSLSSPLAEWEIKDGCRFLIYDIHAGERTDCYIRVFPLKAS